MHLPRSYRTTSGLKMKSPNLTYKLGIPQNLRPNLGWRKSKLQDARSKKKKYRPYGGKIRAKAILSHRLSSGARWFFALKKNRILRGTVRNKFRTNSGRRALVGGTVVFSHPKKKETAAPEGFKKYAATLKNRDLGGGKLTKF